MNLLVFGENGQLASELKMNCPKTIFPKFVGRKEYDLVNEDGICNLFKKYNPDSVINAAAFTDVDKSELSIGLARKINAVAPKFIAKEAKKRNIPYIHLSTDYVFNNCGLDAINESAIPNPLSAYGKSKLEGENNIIKTNCNYLILRTSWVFSRYGKNFVKTILDLSQNREVLKVVNDQIGGPTPASEIANACYEILLKYKKENLKSEILHFSGFPDVSWAEFASEIILQSKNVTRIMEVSTKDYRATNQAYIAKRPSNSMLDCNLINHLYGIKRPDWRHYLEEIIKLKELDT